MSFMFVKVIFAAFFLECLVYCSEYKSSEKYGLSTSLLKREKDWIKDIGNVIKTKREAYHLIKLREDAISQTHLLDGPKIPVNIPKSFLVIVRLTKLWPMICAFVRETFGIPCKVASFPVDVPAVWNFGVVSLLKVHQSQNISAETFAVSMEGPYHTTNRLAPICYEIGSSFFKMRYAHLATEWLLVALNRAQGNEGKDLRLQVLEYLHLAQCFKGDSKAAIKSLLMLLEEFPKFNPSLNLRDEYNMTANTSCPELAYKIKPSQVDLINTEFEDKKQPCQHLSKDPSILKHLHCYVLDSILPHCRIQPLRLEELGEEPPSVLFHGFMNKREQKAIKNILQISNILFSQDCGISGI